MKRAKIMFLVALLLPSGLYAGIHLEYDKKLICEKWDECVASFDNKRNSFASGCEGMGGTASGDVCAFDKESIASEPELFRKCADLALMQDVCLDTGVRHDFEARECILILEMRSKPDCDE